LKSDLASFDKSLAQDLGAGYLVGIDEAGRGPLAGPVVAAAVLLGLPAPDSLQAARDSKAMTPAGREALFPKIRSSALGLGLGWALPEEIDRLNILRASLLAMRRAVERLGPLPAGAWALVDGNREVPGLPISQRTLVRGDALSQAVAAASVAAKVVRDRWMAVIDLRYPGYSFGANKGYGTRGHLEALRRLGPCPEHRRSFGPVAVLEPPLEA
jgi:ribonuclease HII